MVSSGMGVTNPSIKIGWEMMYEKDVKYAINNKRNSVAQDMKRTLIGKLVMCKYVIYIYIYLICF